jgi:hypothetical protein
MRREAAFSLVGFLAGFVVAAFAFWRPAGSQEGAKAASAPVAKAAARSEIRADGLIERGQRPVVVSAVDNGAVEPVVAKGVAPKSAADLLHEALASLPGLDASKRQAAVKDLIAKLRAAGPEGLQVVRDFFRAGQDVKLQGGYGMANGRVTQEPSLRVALLNALEDWPGTGALDLTREVLSSTPRMFEAAIAIRQLEAKAPGVYRAEAIRTLEQLASAPPDRDGFYAGNTLFDALAYFKAPELIPAAEKLVQKNGWAAAQYLQALANFPPDVRASAMERLFSQPDVVKQLASNQWALQNLNYTDPFVSQNVAQMFESGMDKKARERFLEGFSNSNAMYVKSNAFAPGAMNISSAPQTEPAARIASLQGKMALLDAIAPQCTTPVLQERLADARAEVKNAIENPAAAAKVGSATIQMGGAVGNMVIQSDSISVIQSTGGGAVIEMKTEK